MSELIKIPPILAGVAGEYYVAAELSRRGHIASISLRNTRGIDILATNQAGTRSITIQVKANQLSRPVWILSEKSENFYAENHFYVFVALSSPLARPAYHIVPSRTVANLTKFKHAEWLASPGRNGAKHRDSAVRQFEDSKQEYFERWDLLGLETSV
jgi:hypothetical protein